MLKYACCSILVLPFLVAVQALGASYVAVTVDDLPVHGELPSGQTPLSIAKDVIDALKRHQVPGVYGFVNGITNEYNKNNSKVLTEWAKAGFNLGNHTYSHLDLADHTVKEYIDDILRNEKVLESFSAGQNYHMFRYPYLSEGDTAEKKTAIRDFLRGNGYKIAQVTVNFEDWAWNVPYARCLKKGDYSGIEFLKKSYLNMAKAYLHFSENLAKSIFQKPINHVLMLHLGGFDAVMMDDLLNTYKQEKVEFIGLDEALDDEAYSENPEYISRNGISLLEQLMYIRDLPYPAVEPIPYEQLSKLCQ